MLGKEMKNPTDVGRFQAILKTGDLKIMSTLPKRDGNRPAIAPLLYRTANEPA
jgi:hypothetical protein